MYCALDLVGGENDQLDMIGIGYTVRVNCQTKCITSPKCGLSDQLSALMAKNRTVERMVTINSTMDRAKKTVKRVFSHFLSDLPRKRLNRMIATMFAGSCAPAKTRV